MEKRKSEAEAKKEALIAVAEGESKAIDLINSASPDAAYITLQGFEALKALADGQSTKIIVPSEIQNVAGLLTSITETIKTDNIKIEKSKSKAGQPKIENDNKKSE